MKLLWVLCAAALAAAFPGTAHAAELFGGVHGKLLAVFFVLGLCGSAGAYAPGMALFEVAVFFMLYAVAVAIGGEVARHGPRALRLIGQAVAVAGAFYTLKFVVAYCASFSLGKIWW